MSKIEIEKFQEVNKYYQSGLSAKDISLKLGVSLDAVYYFFRKHNIVRRSPKENSELLFKNKKPSFSIKSDLSNKDRELFVAGVMLYWAEGSKWSGEKIVDFANSDPSMIKIFLKFLRDICGISENKLRMYIYCHDSLSKKQLIKYWSSLTNVPMNQFTEPYVKKGLSKGGGNKMKNGLVHIRYGDKKLLNLMRFWIKDLSTKL